MHDPAQIWLLARTSGIIAYVLLTTAVVAGLALRTRMFGRAIPPALVGAVHGTLSTVGLLATALHAGLLVLDTKVNIPLVAVFVPGLTDYRWLATSLGVVAMELWIIVHASFLVRRWIGVTRWRSLHRVTFAIWGVAALHGITAGSDSGAHWMQETYAVTIALVTGLLVYRSGVLASGGPQRPAARPTARQTPITTTAPQGGAS